MATLTIRLPDDKHSRLKALAQSRGVSMNKLMEELSTLALAEFDAQTRFRALAIQGSVEQGLDVLARLDALYQYQTGAAKDRDRIEREWQEFQNPDE